MLKPLVEYTNCFQERPMVLVIILFLLLTSSLSQIVLNEGTIKNIGAIVFSSTALLFLLGFIVFAFLGLYRSNYDIIPLIVSTFTMSSIIFFLLFAITNNNFMPNWQFSVPILLIVSFVFSIILNLGSLIIVKVISISS